MRTKLQIDVKIMLRDAQGEPFMGIGLVWLLAGIAQHRSIARAAREMELSYPKALRMLKNVERGLGQTVVVRRKGGSGHGGAELTPLGRDLLRRYDRLQRRIKRLASAEFARAFAAPLVGPGAARPGGRRAGRLTGRPDRSR